MALMDLLGDDSNDDVTFAINENYAQKYDRWRQGEELQKLKDKYGDNDYTNSSSSEDEDEDGRELTEDIERNFFKTLSSLKEKNPKIYDKNIQFFEEKPIIENNKRQKGEKKNEFYSVAQYQRNLLLKTAEYDNDNEVTEKFGTKMTVVEEEKALKSSFKNILQDVDSDNEESGWGSLLKKRKKTDSELKNEEADYKLWLAGQRQKLFNKEEEKDLKGLHDYWTNPGLDEGEQFLKDYILNKRFLEKDEGQRIPSYEEIVHDSDSGLSADESTLEKQEEFERKYNFRFEEPDHEFVKRFPRTMEHSMRKKDERRKKRRSEIKIRKEAEKAKKLEELKRLKSLKKKEIMERIKRLKDITGNEDMGFKATDLEGEFNPDEHDKRMSELFNADYYGTCADEERPEYPELDKELEIENWDEWHTGIDEQEALHCEDPGFNMDCDYNPENKNSVLQEELLKSSRKGKKRRRSKFAEAIARDKPLFDPKDKTFEKYIDEYYALDYEDIIGDLPCRFKYRKVVPNDFGLTVEEILAAPDKELNSWVSVKKIMQRRPQSVELYDVQAYKKKARNLDKKRKCLPSLYDAKDFNLNVYDEKSNQKESNMSFQDNPSIDALKNQKFVEKSKNIIRNGEQKLKKKQQCHDEEIVTKMKSNSSKLEIQTIPKTDSSSAKEKKKVKKNKQNKGCFLSSTDNNKNDKPYNISDERLKSYGINPKKLKNKLKFGSEK